MAFLTSSTGEVQMKDANATNRWHMTLRVKNALILQPLQINMRSCSSRDGSMLIIAIRTEYQNVDTPDCASADTNIKIAIQASKGDNFILKKE